VSVSNRGATWEYTRSLWIAWTCVPFLNFIAFLYIGMRARQNKWLVAGFLYMIPLLWLLFGPSLFATDAELHASNSLVGWVFNMLGFLGELAWWFVKAFIWFLIGCLGCVISFVHALLIRKEYLVRRSVQREHGERTMHDLRNELEVEHGVNVRAGQMRDTHRAPKTRREGEGRVFSQDE